MVKKQPNPILIPLIFLGAVVLVMCCGVGYQLVDALMKYGGPTPSYSERPELEAQGNFIVKQILAYQAKHGDLPKTLEDLNVKIPSNRYGGWAYFLREDGTAYLRTGDYAYNGFQLTIQLPEADSWYWDT